jgi:hypothetical protein
MTEPKIDKILRQVLLEPGEKSNFDRIRELSPKPTFDSDATFPQKENIVTSLGETWQYEVVNDKIVSWRLLGQPASANQTAPIPTIDIYIQDGYKINKTPELLTVDVVISREGTYPYPERSRTEAKLGSDLKQATRYIDSIPAFDRHPMRGERGLGILLGTVKNITFNNKVRVIHGKDLLWRELVEQYDNLNDAILRKKEFAVSVGQYNVSGPPGILNGVPYQASQRQILLDHLAHLVDGSIPRCGIGKCGFEIDGISNDSLNLLSKLADAPPKKPCPLNNENIGKVLRKLI